MPCRHEDHENEVMYFARTNYRNQLRKFGIKTDDRRRHTYVIGKTGMGKTTLMENMILEDIYAGHGCAYVDPHGDTAEKLINYIPDFRMKDVVYFNPSDFEFPVGFNILESVDFTKRHVIASGLMGVFKKIWPDVWSARMEHILNNVLLTLLENPGNTLLGVNRVLVERDFRRKMIAGVKDPVVKSFWLTEFEQWDTKFRTEAIAPIQNKVGQFLSTAIVRNIVAQRKSTIEPREIMDSGKIFIVNLSKGRIGEDAMRLIGGMLITKLQLCAMERVDIPEKERQDFYLYIDEFQNFATESFASILSEARKYRLCLTMAHQYVDQLSEEVRYAVFGNVGTIITFRIGSPDAIIFEQEFTPTFIQEDLVNLPKYCVYLRLMIDGVVSKPFSAITLSPIANATGSEEEALEFSRSEYGRKRADVEEAILKWSEMAGDEEDLEAVFARIEEKKKEEKKAKYRPKHEYDCTRCQKKMVLPVELDRSRPIYCEDCIDIVKEERKNKKGGTTQPRPFVAKPKPDDTDISKGEIVTKQAEASISLDAISKAVKDTSDPKLNVGNQTAPRPANANLVPALSGFVDTKSNQQQKPDNNQNIGQQTSGSYSENSEKRKRKRKKKKPHEGQGDGSTTQQTPTSTQQSTSPQQTPTPVQTQSAPKQSYTPVQTQSAPVEKPKPQPKKEKHPDEEIFPW
ncbi:MAG: hypothetical protein ABIH21_02350 [Patescibacteria group bacterium]